MRLTEANRIALAHVRAAAERERPRHLRRIAAVLAGTRVEADPEALLRAVSGEGVLTVNFHPDRLLADGRSVAEALREEGVYRSQFETGVSNGALTAYPGGDRDAWERAMLAPWRRCSSASRPVKARWGEAGWTCGDGVLRGDLARGCGPFAPASERHTLNDYVEAQVHGVVGFAADVDALVRPAVSVVRDPERWQEWGAPREVLQHRKDLWVMVVALGEPPIRGTVSTGDGLTRP